MVAAVALHTAAKLLGVNPLQDLRKYRSSSTHPASLARFLLAENANLNPYRSHPKNSQSPLFANCLTVCRLAQPDDSGPTTS
jgi:hypothetical protein